MRPCRAHVDEPDQAEPEERRPTDDAAVVHVSGPVNVSASIEENADGVEHSMRRSEMERRRVVAEVASVWIRAVLEE